MAEDVRERLDRAPMGRLQIVAIGLCVVLNALDGFDVLAISFAAPGIATEWGIDRAALGLVLSMELIGMAAGSLALGGLADRVGRRPVMLLCLVVMAAGMFGATQSDNVALLSAVRLFTGLGIGGMLACANAMVAELANARSRNLAVALMAAGYPLGAVLGGSFASFLLVSGDWRDIFLFGGIVTSVFLPMVWLLMPESVSYLAHARPPGALERINAILARMGHDRLDAMPPADEAPPKVSIAALFAPGLVRTTLLLTLAYFAHIMTFYFVLKWIPKIVVDLGYQPALAGGVLVWANVGGLAGALLLSLLSWRIAVRSLVVAAMFAAAAMVMAFGQSPESIVALSSLAAAAGFFNNAAIVGIYAIIAQSFPVSVRAGGTGFVIGVGRAGAASGPVVAGYLFSIGFSLPVVAAAMACGPLIGASALMALRMTGDWNRARRA